MNTKSQIQLIRENLEMKSNFKNAIENILEKYNIKDNIFTWNGWLTEPTRGYFVVNEEVEDLNEAISKGDAIRIIENNKFQAGIIYFNINDCPKDKTIINIENLQEIKL